MIHSAGFKCPTIAGKAQERRFEELGIESEVETEISNLNVPPGFENELNNIVDFDGVIHTFDKGWYDGTCYGEPIEGSIEAIKKLSQKWNVIIFTAKAKPDRPLVNEKTGKELVEEWLEMHGVLECERGHFREAKSRILHIDDKGLHFNNNWDEI